MGVAMVDDSHRIRVIDRQGLESVVCECYLVVRDEFDRSEPIREFVAHVTKTSKNCSEGERHCHWDLSEDAETVFALNTCHRGKGTCKSVR